MAASWRHGRPARAARLPVMTGLSPWQRPARLERMAHPAHLERRQAHARLLHARRASGSGPADRASTISGVFLSIRGAAASGQTDGPGQSRPLLQLIHLCPRCYSGGNLDIRSEV